MNADLLMQLLAIAVIPLLFAITLHEAAHGWMAAKCGDQTALLLGRVSTNPLRHIDKVGTLVVPIVTLLFTGFIFGWAKPVPINPNNFKYLRINSALVALAGPFSNLLMAFFWGAVAKCVLLVSTHDASFGEKILRFIMLNAQFGILINIALCSLNLLPLPPLDGSRIVSAILPAWLQVFYEKAEPLGTWILLALLLFGLLNTVLTPMVQWGTLKISLLYNIPPFHGI